MADVAPIVDAAEEQKLAEKFVQFLNNARSAYEAVSDTALRKVTTKSMLKDAGFEYVSERGDWTGSFKPGGKYFTTRNQSTIVAWAIGKKYDPSKGGFNITAAHTDSPCLKVKPISKISAASFLQVGMECYGGGLWHTWFDRDLGLSGRVFVQEGDKVVAHIVTIDKPILRIPTLAIHLNRTVNDDGFKFNKEEHLIPIISSTVKTTLTTPVASATGKDHHPVLLSLLSEGVKCDATKIEGFDLSLFDTQPATLGGAHNEFIFGGRLDNLMMSFVCMDALIKSTTDELLENETQVQLSALFDNEEIGSDTAHGAGSTLMQEIIERIGNSFTNNPFSLPLALRKSFLFSCDMAHALHPNYRSKHEDNHRPLIHYGPVVKENCNARYATTAETKYLTRALAQKKNIPIQAFVVRNDALCGSTIGPILASGIGIRCVDVGIPQTSMHSIREMAGTADLVHASNLLRAFHTDFAQLDASVVTDDI